MKKAKQTSINAAAIQRAISHHQKGELFQAEAMYREVLRVEPKNADALHLLGMIAHQVGKNEAAIELIEKAIAVNRTVPLYHNNAGTVYHALNILEKAIACYRRALSLNPNDPMALTNLGKALQGQGKLEEAIDCHRRALSIQPDFHIAHTNLGSALKDQGKLEEATACYRRALSLNPDDPMAHTNLGSVFQDQGKLEESIACHRRALSLNPDDSMIHTNLGSVLQDQGKLEVAVASYRHALSIKPDDQLTHFNLSIVYLLTGNFKEGWKEYKYRFRRQAITEQPYWDGSEIKGKTLLLHAEQGFGDTIQFIRYIPMVLKKCDKIIVACQKELIEVMQRISGIRQVVPQGQQLPDFDYHCPLLDLPSVFNTTLETVPATIPYLSNDTQKVSEWRARLQDNSAKLKIGLCWAGNPTHKNDRNRSIPLSTFSMLGEMENITFYSLQKGEAAEQAKNPPGGIDLVDYTNDLNDFSDTAALIENLDLIISVDTSVVHLAGALGRPVWTLLPFMPDWRWMLDRGDSPWYPTMRLFRQSERRDWAEVIFSIKGALVCLDTQLRRQLP